MILTHFPLLIRSWFLAAAFYFLLISPFVVRIGRESVQVAELLSQLPDDLDAEGLVKSMVADSVRKKKEKRRSSLTMTALARPPSPLKAAAGGVKRASIEIAGPPLLTGFGIGKRGNRRVSVENV